MRRAIVIAPLLASSSVAFADPPIRVDAGITGSWVSVSDRNGAGMVVEIKALANEQLAIGGRVELAMMFGGTVGADVELGFAMAACGLLKTEYYLLPGPIKPFLSGGVGVYSVGAQILAGPGIERNSSGAGRYLGFAPQLGIDVGRLRIAATYNAIVGASFDVMSSNGTRETVSPNYLSLEASFQFGSARKPPPPPAYPSSASPSSASPPSPAQ